MNLGSFFWPSTEPPDGIFHATPLSKHFGFTFFAIDPIASRLKKITLIHACFVRGILSRCSKLFYIILSKYFYFALRSCTAFVCPALSHIARYAPSHRTNNYGTITQFKCKNNFEHLLKKNSLNAYVLPIRQPYLGKSC